jgi:hypothetical protein
MINIGWGCLVCSTFVGILPVMLVTLFMILKLVMKRVVQFLSVLVFYVDRRLES